MIYSPNNDHIILETTFKYGTEDPDNWVKLCWTLRQVDMITNMSVNNIWRVLNDNKKKKIEQRYNPRANGFSYELYTIKESTTTC
jgi:hypothetical protein